MKQKRKISFAICGATLVVITALIIVILPVIFFIHDFEEAVKTKNTQYIETMFWPGGFASAKQKKLF